jgi:hypothetical protein
MAFRDYRLCDVCGNKAFYDMDLAYEYDPEIENVKGEDYSLQNLGDWKVLCKKCAETHEVVIVKIG